MAGDTILVKERKLVIRLCRLVVIGLVTGEAAGRRTGILSRVAGDTSGLSVRAGQRERGGAMIVERRLPGSCGVAERAVMRESARFVIRLDSRGEFRAMT